MPRQPQSLRRSNAHADAGKASRPDIDEDLVRLAAIWQSSDEREQAFRVATANDFMLCGYEIMAVE
jgi:hypothetical protein